MASVVLQNVSKKFGKTEIIQGLNLVVESNQLTVFVGPSGCGKSTILRCIAGLEEVSAGEIRIDGQLVNDVPPFRRGIAMVFQSYALYPHMTVYENMRFGLISLKLPKAEIEKRIAHAAEMLALTPYLQRKPKQLSGGQRQRVAMGRALVRQPKVFLFDEPLSNLDAALRTRMRVEIARLRKSLSATAIYVTHDQVEAMTLADKIVVLRGGKVEQEGTPLDIYHRPANRFVASFIGSPAMNFVPARLKMVGPAGQIEFESGSPLEVKAPTVSGQHEVEFGIRPEHVSLDTNLPGKLRGKVFAIEKLGDQSLVHMHLDGTPQKGMDGAFVARLPGEIEVGSDGELELGFDPSRVHLFETGGAVIPSHF
ncbi:sn-glycerol-3-phosphate ABC transporter ATP-binding protein UgpC [bacterium]|nr:sn-glycerol-3-phosphate ABC transporter ATP-binding protein UgpC [bacterium]